MLAAIPIYWGLMSYQTCNPYHYKKKKKKKKSPVDESFTTKKKYLTSTVTASVGLRNDAERD